MSKKETRLNLFQEPTDFGFEIIDLLIDIEEKYGIEIQDVDVEELVNDRFEIFDIKWKPSYIKEFRDTTTSDDWKDWANRWLEEYDK